MTEYKKMATRAILNFFLLLVLPIGHVQSQLSPSHSSSSSQSQPPSQILLNSLSFSAAESCKQMYGFLPCTTSPLGNLFLVIVYGSINMLLRPSDVNGLFVQFLSALPNAMLILVSGLRGSKRNAQSEVADGMDWLAGSTVMLLTILWATCILVGKCDLEDSTAIDLKDAKRFSLTGSGVTVDSWTRYTSWIMVISVVPFIIVQLPHIFHASSGRRLAVLVSLIITVALLISYCLYPPWVQRRRKLEHESLRKMNSQERQSADDSIPKPEIIKEIFMSIDQDCDNRISLFELRAFIRETIWSEEIKPDHHADAVETRLLSDFDTSIGGYVDVDGFVKGVMKMLMQDQNWPTCQGNEVVEDVENSNRVSFRSGLRVLLGAAIAAPFGNPLLNSLNRFSTATHIPSFFTSYIALPLATNCNAVLSALKFARQKKKRTASQTFDEIYGAVAINNILCIAAFLVLVYVRELTWDFSAEVLIIIIVCIVMGLFTSFRTTFPLWSSAIAYALYPFSLLLVHLFDHVFC